MFLSSPSNNPVAKKGRTRSKAAGEAVAASASRKSKKSNASSPAASKPGPSPVASKVPATTASASASPAKSSAPAASPSGSKAVAASGGGLISAWGSLRAKAGKTVQYLKKSLLVKPSSVVAKTIFIAPGDDNSVSNKQRDRLDRWNKLPANQKAASMETADIIVARMGQEGTIRSAGNLLPHVIFTVSLDEAIELVKLQAVLVTAAAPPPVASPAPATVAVPAAAAAPVRRAEPVTVEQAAKVAEPPTPSVSKKMMFYLDVASFGNFADTRQTAFERDIPLDQRTMDIQKAHVVIFRGKLEDVEEKRKGLRFPNVRIFSSVQAARKYFESTNDYSIAEKIFIMQASGIGPEMFKFLKKQMQSVNPSNVAAVIGDADIIIVSKSVYSSTHTAIEGMLQGAKKSAVMVTSMGDALRYLGACLVSEVWDSDDDLSDTAPGLDAGTAADVSQNADAVSVAPEPEQDAPNDDGFNELEKNAFEEMEEDFANERAAEEEKLADREQGAVDAISTKCPDKIAALREEFKLFREFRKTHQYFDGVGSGIKASWVNKKTREVSTNPCCINWDECGPRIQEEPDEDSPAANSIVKQTQAASAKSAPATNISILDGELEVEYEEIDEETARDRDKHERMYRLELSEDEDGNLVQDEDDGVDSSVGIEPQAAAPPSLEDAQSSVQASDPDSSQSLPEDSSAGVDEPPTESSMPSPPKLTLGDRWKFYARSWPKERHAEPDAPD
jgi:hypothetical protein